MNKPFDLHDYAAEVCGFGSRRTTEFTPPKFDEVDEADWRQIGAPARLAPVLARLMGKRWAIGAAESIGALDKDKALTELREVLDELHKDAMTAWREC